jgi:hypothetical protein
MCRFFYKNKKVELLPPFCPKSTINLTVRTMVNTNIQRFLSHNYCMVL